MRVDYVSWMILCYNKFPKEPLRMNKSVRNNLSMRLEQLLKDDLGVFMEFSIKTFEGKKYV